MIVSFPIAYAPFSNTRLLYSYGSNGGGSFFFSLAVFFMFFTNCLLGLEKPIEERHQALTILHTVVQLFGLIAYYLGTVWLASRYD